MSKTIYNKLVRDKIPEIIEADNGRPVTRILEDGEYLLELTLKLEEEARELRENPSVEELADIIEVCRAIQQMLGVSDDELEKARQEKLSEKGGFEQRIFLESVKE